MSEIRESPDFLAKVREWNDRYRHSGWRSGSDYLTCPRCGHSGLFIVSTVRGTTTANCTGCKTAWTVEV